MGNYVRSAAFAVGTCSSQLTMTTTWENVSMTQLVVRTPVLRFIALFFMAALVDLGFIIIDVFEITLF